MMALLPENRMSVYEGNDNEGQHTPYQGTEDKSATYDPSQDMFNRDEPKYKPETYGVGLGVSEPA